MRASRTTGFWRCLKRFIVDGEGQDLAEYGVAMAVIGAGAVAVALAIQPNVVDLWRDGARVIRRTAGGHGDSH